MKNQTKTIILHECIRFTAMTVGCCLYALGVDCFLVQNEIVGGGASGLATLIYLVTDGRVGIGIMTIAINIPILLLGLKQLGWKFMLRCLITIGVLALFNELFIDLPILTDNRILASVYGGILQGIGIGLFVKFKVSSGGTELLGREIRHWFKFFSIPVWTAILDAIIILSGAIVLRDIENVLYALILIFVSAKTSDILIMGINRSKLCYIITDRGGEISEFLLSHSPRGITMLEGKGMYTGQEHQVLLTCVKPHQIDQLKAAVRQIDEHAFVIVGDAAEVIGKGFRDMQDKD